MNKRITISPFNSKDINSNSYNYTLGNYVKVYNNYELDSKRKEDVSITTIPPGG